MVNKTQTQAALGNARSELKDTLERVKELRVKVKNLRLDAAAERALNRSARVAEREERKVAREQKRAAKIAAMEQRTSKPHAQQMRRHRPPLLEPTVLAAPCDGVDCLTRISPMPTTAGRVSCTATLTYPPPRSTLPRAPVAAAAPGTRRARIALPALL